MSSASMTAFGHTAALQRAPARVTSVRRGQLQVRSAVKDVFMPALSSTMTEGKIVSWLKSPGDKVKKGESIVVVESDKADMDVECFNDGYLGAIVIPEGGTAQVGEAIAFIAESEAEMDAAKAKAGGSAPAAAAAPAASTSPPPPPPPAAAPAPAVSSAPAAAAPPPPPPPPIVVNAAPRADGRIIVTPYAKKLAKDLGVDLKSVVGSGPAGRITAGDVEAAKNGRGGVAVAPPVAVAAPPPPAVVAPVAAAPSVAPAPARSPATAPAPAAASAATTGTQPFSGMQMAVAKNMLESLKVPEFRVSMTIRTDALDALYKKLKPKGVTMTCLLGKACGAALAKHPVVNAATTPDGLGIKFNERVNVAMAVAMDGGLITPVLKDADQTDIYTMSRQWADLVKRARSKQLAPDEYNSGTFAMSNLGMFGVDAFDAILPPGMGAIIAIGGSKPVVAVDSAGHFGIEKQMVVNLTCDHRHIYGADAAEFLQTLKGIIEDPEQLLFL